MINGRAGFGLVALKTGHQKDINILAIGGVKTKIIGHPEDVEAVDVNSVEQFDGHGWFQINPALTGLPAGLSRITVVAIPNNITVHCGCVPDKTSERCAYLLPKKKII